MKTGLLLILFLIVSLGLSAQTTDEDIEFVYTSGDFYMFLDKLYFVANYYEAGEYPDEAEALQYLAEAGYLFALVQCDLEDYTDTKHTDSMKKTICIGCPFKGQHTNYMAYVDMYYIRDKFQHLYMPHISMEERLNLSNEVVKTKHGIFTIDYWNEN
jgi:hypothetical protein